MTVILTDWRTVYKLTDENDQTHNACQWGVGVTNPHGVRLGAGGLCGDGFYHAYHTPELAVLLNPIGANFPAATLHVWRAEIKGVVEEQDHILKLGATEMRTVERLAIAPPSARQCGMFAVLVAQATGDLLGATIPHWDAWAHHWLNKTAANPFTVSRSIPRYAAHAVLAGGEWASYAPGIQAARTAVAAIDAALCCDEADHYSEIVAAIADAAVLALAETWE